jgi:hypothetical protein
VRSGILAVIVVVIATAPVKAQPAEILVDNYLQAVRAYQRNSFDARSSPIAGLSKGDFNKIRPLLQRQQPRVIQSAALVHTEIALTATDGAQIDLQLAMAEAVLKLLPKDFVPRASFTASWYRVVPTIYFARRDPEPARPFIERGLRAVPDDAGLHLLSGMAHEMATQLHAITCAEEGCAPRQQRLDLLKTTGFAAAEYRRALQIDAGRVDAQLRLGRVMTLSGDQREARSALEAVLMNAVHVSHRYLAAVFLASLAADAGDPQRARSQYERALTLCPSCQTAYIGLGALDAMIAGRAAHASIARLFARETRTDTDPWVEYQVPPLDSATLDALRAEVRR